MLLEWKLSWPPYHLTYTTRPSEMVVGNAVCYKLVHFFILPRTSLNQIWCIGAKICLLLKLNTSWVIFASITCVRQNSMINDIDILQTAKDISCPVKVMSAINSMADFISSWSGPFLYRPLMPNGCYPPLAPITFITWARLVLARWSLAWPLILNLTFYEKGSYGVT